MRKPILISMFVLLSACTASAQEQAYGPVQNYDGMQQTSTNYTVPTTGSWFVYNPLTQNIMKFGAWGGQTYTCIHPAPMFVDSYLYVDPCHPDYGARITEVCAYKEEAGIPKGKIPLQRGFTAADPEVVIGAGPFFFAGSSGVPYSASVETCAVGSLAARLSGYDVSKIGGPPENIVYIVQASIPAGAVQDFMGQFEFSIQYQGQTPSGDPCMPYLHSFMLNITQWDPSVPKISDIDWEAPHIVPGYVTIVAPPTWINPGGTWGRTGFEANTGSEIVLGTGSFGWTVKGKTPYVQGGHAYLTFDGTLASPVIKTMIVGQNAATDCGAWGYLAADLDGDCYVGFQDLAILASQWCKCSDPDGTGCSQDTVVGLGIVYNADDTSGPAVVQDLYDTHASGINAGDQIVKFCGVPVANGASLFTATQAMPPLTVGQTVPVTVVRGTAVIDLNLTAISIGLVDTNVSIENRNCTQVTSSNPTTGYTCMCTTGTHLCSCGYQHQPNFVTWHNWAWRGYQVRKICFDDATPPNSCQTPWMSMF
jgi:hypothetical protein